MIYNEAQVGLTEFPEYKPKRIRHLFTKKTACSLVPLKKKWHICTIPAHVACGSLSIYNSVLYIFEVTFLKHKSLLKLEI